MSIHWNPRGRWPGRQRRPNFAWGEIRLMLLGGTLLGLALASFGGDFPATDYSPAAGRETAPQGARLEEPVRFAAGTPRVIDGDTFDLDGARVRIADIDAPETRGRCRYETELAERATRRLRALLAGGPIVLHPAPDGRDEDRHGRKLRLVTANGRPVGDTLVAEGLARRWTGRREPWCG